MLGSVASITTAVAMPIPRATIGASTRGLDIAATSDHHCNSAARPGKPVPGSKPGLDLNGSPVPRASTGRLLAVDLADQRDFLAVWKRRATNALTPDPLRQFALVK